MAAPNYVSSNTAFAGGTNVTLNKPTGVVNGSVLIALVVSQFGAIGSAPSGWTKIEDAPNIGGNIWCAVYKKDITNAAGEPASYTWSVAFGGAGSGLILHYDSGVPDTDGSTTGNSSNVVAPSITTTGSNRTIVDLYATHASTTLTTPAGTTSRTSLENGGVPSLRAVDFSQASAGATTSKTSVSGISNSWFGYSLAIYTALTNISTTRTFKWNVLASISLNRIFKWNVKAAISLTRIFKWNVLATVSTNRIFKWNVRTAVAPFTRTFKWNVIGGVLINRVFKWNVLQTITPTRTFKWNVRVAVAPLTRTFKWNVLQQVSLNKVFKWNVIQTIVASRIFKWNVRQVLSVSRTFKWNVTGFARITRTFLWDVFAPWTKVSKPVDDWTEIPEPVDIWTELERANTGWR